MVEFGDEMGDADFVGDGGVGGEDLGRSGGVGAGGDGLGGEREGELHGVAGAWDESGRDSNCFILPHLKRV